MKHILEAATLTSLVLVACGGPRSAPQASEPHSPVEVAHEAAVERSGSEIPDWYGRYDPTCWYAAEVQRPPTGFSAKAESAHADSFPFGAFARVVAYDVGKQPAVTAARQIGHGCSIVASDGTLCPQLVAPGLVLSTAQIQALLSVTAVPQPPWQDEVRSHACRCDFPIASAFVFFDAQDRPVAHLELFSTLQKWNIVPAFGGVASQAAATTAREREVLGQLCQELGLECRQQEPDQDVPAREEPRETARSAEASQRDFARRLLPRLLTFPEGVEEQRPLSLTTEAERRRLCAWHLRAIADSTQARLGYPWSHNPGATLAFAGADWSLGFQNFEECLSKFPSCDEPVSRALETLAAMHKRLGEEDGIPERPKGCVFGIEIGPAAGRAPEGP